jgi:hypothetical protein
MSSRGSRIGTLAGRLAAVAMVLALAAGSAMADKLIIFKNGKVLRVKSVTEEQGWTLAEIGEGNTVGVRTTQIAMVQEAAGDSGKSAPLPNQASVDNRGVNRGGGANQSARRSEGDGGASQSTRRSAGVGGRNSARGGRRADDLRKGAAQSRSTQRGRANAAQSGATGLSSLQPLNQQPQGRGFRNSRSTGNRRAPGTRILSPDDQEAADDEDDDDDDE